MAWSARQVTLDHPDSVQSRANHVALHTDAPMWVVKRKTGSEQPGDVTNNEVVESVLGDVVTWREREFP